MGAGLARDAGAAVGQPNRADTIASKPAPTHPLNRCSQQNFHVRTTQAGTLFSCYFPFAVLSLESQLPGGVTRTRCEQGRIVTARPLLKEAPILILDEASASASASDLNTNILLPALATSGRCFVT